MTNKEYAAFYKSYIDCVKQRGVSLEITGKCPLQCPFCSRQNPEHKAEVLKSPDVSLSDLSKSLSFFSGKIRFVGQISDPIYHRNFLHFIKLCSKNQKRKFSIHTTGTRKKQRWWKVAFAISGKNVRWVFGLDGTDQETANIYRVNTRFDEVISAMRLGASMGVEVIWQFIVFRHNEHQVETAKCLAKEIGVTLEIIISDRWYPHLMDIYKIYPPIGKEWNNEINGVRVPKYIYIKPQG
jgi:MoaA/NifB/PqqE/SkfB family radical SAM enzyme